MQTKVLVAYASRYGSTQEVAEAIAAPLRENNLEVDLKPMREVKTLEEYTAVVLGAPIYLLGWLKDAHSFLSRHRETLTSRQVAVFALGPLSSDENEWKEVREQLDKELAKFPWFKPIAIEVFGGKFDPKKLHLSDKIIVSLPASPLHNLPASDLRDWITIRAWAGSLVTQFQPAVPQ
jgi:menaquinone-dependent protoporphyrinogen oxidase